jgi:threonine/homoserine/homoserine lactone efflux protein
MPPAGKARAVHQLLLGLSLGLGSGLAPGPLLALVIRSSLERGFAAGARVAVSPLVTDVPVIAVAVVLAARLPMAVLGALGIGGGAFVLWLGVKGLREQTPPAEAAADAASPHTDLRRGALTNLLSPHPWMFWITVGAPILVGGGIGGAVLFLGAFYVLLIGTKVGLAWIIATGRSRLIEGRGYTAALRVSGLLLVAAGVLLIIEGTNVLRT